MLQLILPDHGKGRYRIVILWSVVESSNRDAAYIRFRFQYQNVGSRRSWFLSLGSNKELIRRFDAQPGTLAIGIDDSRTTRLLLNHITRRKLVPDRYFRHGDSRASQVANMIYLKAAWKSVTDPFAIQWLLLVLIFHTDNLLPWDRIISYLLDLPITTVSAANGHLGNMAVSLFRAWLEGDWRMLTPRMLAWTQAISWWLAFSVVMTSTLTGVRDVILSVFADSLIRATGSPKRQTRWKLKKRGVLVIANLQLSPVLLDDLDLPVSAHSAKVETLELSLPLLAFVLARNISLQIRGFHVELTSRKFPSERDCHGLDAQVEAEKRARQRQRLTDIDRLLWDDNTPPPSFMQKFQDFLIFAVASRAAQCVQVSISQVTIRFRPSSLSSLPDHLHRTLSLRLDSLSLSNGPPASTDLLLPRAKVVDVRGCKLELVNEPSRPSAPSSGVQAGNGSAPAGKTDSYSRLPRQAPPRAAVTVVKRWSFSVTVEAGWGLWHQGSKNSGVVVSASLDMGALIMSANEVVVEYLYGLAVDLTEFTDYAKYRQTRPRASVLEDPRAWWRHAIGNVARDLRAAAMDVELTGLSQSRQATLRMQYEKQYSDFVAGRCWSMTAAQTRLQQLEQQLGTFNCALVRFRVALTAESEGLSHNEPAWDQHMADVRSKLQDLNYLLSGGSVPEPQAQKPVIEVSSRFTCPKLCVLLTSASNLDWGAEVSLHEVALRFTEGGSLHAEVSCRELLVRNFYVPESELVGNIVHSVSSCQSSTFPSSAASSPSIGPRASPLSASVPGSSQPSPLHPSLGSPAVPAAAAAAPPSSSLSSGSTPFLAVCFVQRYGSQPRPCQLPTCLVGRWHLSCPSELKKPSSGRFLQFLQSIRSDKYTKAPQQSQKAVPTQGERQQQQDLNDPTEGSEERGQTTHQRTEGSRGSTGAHGEAKWKGERELGVLELGWGEDELQRLHTRVEAHMSPLRVFLDRRWLFQLMQLLSSSPSTQSQSTVASQGRVPGHLASQAGKGVTSRAEVRAGVGKGLGGEGAGRQGGEIAMGDAAGGSGDTEWMPDITKQQHYLYHRRGDCGSLDVRSNGAPASPAERRPGTPGGGAGQIRGGGISDGGAAPLNPALFADLQDYVKEFGQHVARKRVQHVRDNLPEVAARVGSILFIIPCRDIDVTPRPSSASGSAATQRSSVPSAGGDSDFQAFFERQKIAQAWKTQGTGMGAQRRRPAALTPPLLVISLSEIILDTRPTESAILQKQDATSESAPSSSDQSLAARWRKVVASMSSHRGWMQRQHVGPLPPNSLEQINVELTMEAYLTRTSLSNVADLRENPSRQALSCALPSQPHLSFSPVRLQPTLPSTVQLLSVELVTSVFIVQLSPLIAKEVSRLVHTLSETFASTGDLSSTSKEPPPPPPVTPGAHQLGWRFSLKGGGFLVEACQEMVPHSKADCPYGVCHCRQWVPSSDTAVVLVSTAEDLRGCPPSTSKSVPPPTAAASASAAAGGSAVEGQPREPVVVVFRVRLDKIRVEAEQHNDKLSLLLLLRGLSSGRILPPTAMVRELFPPGKAMMARVFYRWRLQTVVARGYSDVAIFAAYEALQRAKAQVAVQLQEAGTLHQVAVKVALLPFCCDTNNLSAVLTFLTHLQAAISRTTSAPPGPSNPQALTSGSSEVERDSWGEPTPTALPSVRPNSSSFRSRVSFRDRVEDDVEMEDEEEEAQGGETWPGKHVGDGKGDGSEFGPRVRRTGGGKRMSIEELAVDGSEAGTDVDEDNEKQGKRVSLDDSPLDILGPRSEWHSNGAPWEGMSEMRTRGRSRDGGEKDGRGEGCRVYSMSGWRERRRGWQGNRGEGESGKSNATSEVWKLQAELGCGMVIMSIGGVSFGSVIMQRVKVDLTSQPDAVDVDLTVGDLDVVDMLANSKHYSHIFEPNGDLPSLNLVIRQNMVQRGPNLPAKPQVCVFVESQQTRMTAIFRFFNDFALFVERMAPIFSPPQAPGPSKEGGGSTKGQDAKREGSKQGEGKAAGDSDGEDAPPLVFLHISDLSLCLPVSSWSEESLDVRVETINLIVPTPASQRLSQHTLLRLATGIRPHDPSFWKPLVDALDRSPPASPDSVGIQLSRVGGYWSPSKTITPKVERNIISESGVFISVQSNPSRVHVHWPQVEIHLGLTQYNAIMTLIFQNLAEGCSFTDDQVYNPMVGRPMGGEAAPPDPCISLAGLTPDLEIQLDFGRAVIHAEMEHPATLVENGFGDPLLSLRAHRLTIVYSNYTDFSQVTVKAFRLLLRDDRFLKFSQSELALIETNSSRAKPPPTSASTSTRLSTPPTHTRNYTTPMGGESGQGLGCDLDRSFLVNVVMKAEGTTGVQVVFERTSIVWPFYTDLSLVWEFLEVVAGYFQKPGCALGPISLQPDSWLMANILLHDFDLLLPVPEESLINVCPPPSSSHHSSPPHANPPLATPSPITADSSPAFHSAQSRMPPPSTLPDRFYDASEVLPASRRSGSVGAGGAPAGSGFGRSGSSGSGDSGQFESARNTFEEPVWVPELQVWSDDVYLFLSELKAHGLKIRGQTLRVGHFAGGDGESKLLVDFIRVSSVFIHQSQYFAPHDVIGEFTAQLLFNQHSPKCANKQASLLSLHITPDLHPSLSASPRSSSPAAFPASATGGQSSSSAVKSGRLPIYFVFSHLVVLSSFLRTLNIRLKRSQGNLLHQNLDLYGDPLPPAFVPSKLGVNLQIHELFVALIDDRMGNPTSVLELVAKDIAFNATSQILTDGGPELLSCRLSLTLLSNFLNSGFEIMEPMTEAWQLGADMKSTGNHVTIAVQSHQLLNVMFTPMQLRSLGDALNFYTLLSNSLLVLPGGSLHGSDRDELGSGASSSTAHGGSVPPATSARMTRAMSMLRAREYFPKSGTLAETLEASLQEVAVGMVSYRMVNLSGHTLYYWTEKDEEKSKTYSVEEGEEQVLEVQPVQKVVTLRDTRKILARTICVKLKGDWLPINDIVMDKVGKYVMDLRLPGSTVVLPVVFDVTLKSRTKIITVHSTMHLRNDLDVPLVFFALLPSPKETGGETAKSSSQVKKFSLEKDVVALDPEHLLEQQGLLEFPILNQGGCSPLVGSSGGTSSNRLLTRFGSMTRRHSDGGGSLRLSELGSVKRGSMANEGEDEFERSSGVGSLEEFDSASDVRRPFYCCLQVNSDPLAHSASNGLYEEFTLSFVPPVAIQNGLPYDLEAYVWDVEWGTRHIVYVPSGESRDLYHVSLDHTLQMHIALFVPGGEYRTRRRYPIHFPPNPLLQKQFGSRAFAYDVRTLRLAVKCRLFPQHAPSASPITLSIDNRHNWQSRNRSISLLAHYWVINLTKFRLKLSTGSSQNPLDCPRYQEGQPALLNVRRGAITAISLDGFHWSKSISIDSVGIKGSVAVAGPASTASQHHHHTSDHALMRQQTTEEWENVVQLEAPAGTPSRRTTAMSPFPALRRFEFGVEVRLAPSLCEGTKLVIISPRFMVSNQTGQAMQIAQIGTTTARVLADKMRQPFHWDDEKLGTYLVARLLSSEQEEDDMDDGTEAGAEEEGGEEEEDEVSLSSDGEHSEGEEEGERGEGVEERHAGDEVRGMQRLPRDSEDSLVSCESMEGREQVQTGASSIGSEGCDDGGDSYRDKKMGLPKAQEGTGASKKTAGKGRRSKGGEMDVDWDWSGAFDIDKPGESAVRIKHRRKRGKYAILSIDVSLNGASALVTFGICGSKHKPPPYRIENRSAFMTIKYGQLTTPTRQRLPPNRSTNYAWDQPRMAQLLQVEIEGFGVTREYDLDGIRELPTIILSEDDFTGNASLRDRMFVMVGTQARAVAALYVNVYADGATRVLSFSDTKHTSKVSEEDERTTLQEKLQVTSERIDFARKVLHRARALAGDAPLDALEAQPSYIKTPEYSAAMASFTPNHPPSVRSTSSSSSARSARQLRRSSSDTPVASTSRNPSASVVTATGAGSVKERFFSRADSEGSSPRTPPETFPVFTGSSSEPSPASKAAGALRIADAGEYAGKAERLRGQEALDYLYLPGSAAAVPEYPMRLVEVTAYGVQAGMRAVKEGMEVVEGVGGVAEKTLKGNGLYVEAVKVLDAEVSQGNIVEMAKHVESAAADVKGMPKSAAQALSKEKSDGAEAVAVKEGARQGEVVKEADTAAADAAASLDESTAAGKIQGVSASAASAGELAESDTCAPGAAATASPGASATAAPGSSANAAIVSDDGDAPSTKAGGRPWERVKRRLGFMSQGKGKRKAQLLEPKQEENDSTGGEKGEYDGGEHRRSERLVQEADGELNHEGLETDELSEKARILSCVREGSEEESEGEEEGGEQGSSRDAGREQGAGIGAGVTGSDGGRISDDGASGPEKESVRVPPPELGARPTRGRVTWKGVVDKVSVGTTAAVVNTGKRVTGAASALHSAASAFLDGTSEKVQEKFHEAKEAFEEAEERAGEWRADEGFKAQVGAMRTVRSMESFFGRQADKLVKASHVADMVKSATTAELRAHWPHDSFRLPSSRSEGGESVGEGEGSELMPVPTFDELQNMAGAAAVAEREFIGKNRPSGLVMSASVAAGQMAAVARRGQDVVVKAGSVVKGAVGSALVAGSEAAVAEGKALVAGTAVALNVMGGRLGDIKEHAEQDVQVSLADWRRRMQEAGIGAEEEEDISELRQERIHLGDEEYDAGAIVGGDVTVHVIKAMDLGLRPEKTHPYAVAQVEGRRLRSSVCKGTVCPQWDELLVFKGVSTTSSMAVSIFSSETIGSHKFLGQVVLPLVDGRALNREPGWHKLSRRTAHETVTGRVFLSTSWDATELELMALQLRAKEAELDALEERLAQEREARPREAVMAAEALANPLALLPRTPSSALRTPTGGPCCAACSLSRALGGWVRLPRPCRLLRCSSMPLRASSSTCQTHLSFLFSGRGRVPEGWLHSNAISHLCLHSPSTHRSTHLSLLTSLYSPLSTHLSLLTALYSPLSTHRSLLSHQVKVVEARHLAVPAEWLRSVHRMHAFAALSVVSPSGTSTLPVKTRVIKGSFFPKWNETFTINDAALTSSLRVQVFDKPKLGSPNLLGEATVDVATFKDGLPQYLLLTLKRSAAREGEQEAVGGSIRLRVHWMVDHGKKAEEKTGVNFMVNLHGMTVSIVDRLPREIMLVLLEEICCSWEESVKEVAGKVEVGKLQVDNQLLTARNPVVLSRTQAFPAEALFMEQGKELANQAALAGMLNTDPSASKEKEKAFISVEFTRLLQHPSIVYYRRFLFQLQEFDLVLEEDFVDTVVAYLQQLPMDDLWQEKDKRGGEEEEEKKDDEDMMEDMAGAPIARTYLTRDATMISPSSRRHLVKSEQLEPLVNRSSWVAGNQGLRWYFERFQVQPMRINVTLVMNPIKSDAPPPSGSSSEWHLRTTASSAGFPLIPLTRAPLRLNSLVLDNAFQNQSTLQTYVLRHYGVQLLQGLHKILGSVELLGAPLSLVDNLATGVMDFFVEPASATTPEEFLSGAVKGTVSLMKHSSYGVLHSISSLAGGIGTGFAKLTFDDSYIQRFSQRPEGTSQQVLRGAQDLGLGFVGAVTGLVLQPLEGARREGAVGAVKGVGKGVVGLVTKPLSGLLGFASTLTESAGTGSGRLGGTCHGGLSRGFGCRARLGGMMPSRWSQRTTSGRKALLFTVVRLIFYDCQRNVFYWQIPLKDITSVMGMEGRLESIILYEADVVIARKKLPLRVPARKVIKTTTRELHMALLVKLNRHLARIRATLQSSSSPSTPRHASREPVAAGAAADGSVSSSRPPSAGSTPALSPSPSLPSPLRLAQSPGNVSELSAGSGKAAGRPGKATGAGIDGPSSGGGGGSSGSTGRAHNRKQSSLSKALSLQREEQEEDEKAEEEKVASEAAHVVSVSGGAAAATAATRWKKQANTRDGAGRAADKGKAPAELTHSRSAPARARKSSFRRGKAAGGGGCYDLGKHAVIHEDVDMDAAHLDQDNSDEDDYSEDANGVAARVTQLDREERQEVRRNLDAILTTCQVASASAGGRSDPASALVSVKFLALAAYSREQSHRAHQATLGVTASQGVGRGDDSQWEEDVSALLRTMVALTEGGETGSSRDQAQILGTLEAICHQAIGRVSGH
ncbi:unnamed protein product [Closterium sp. Yama58-4]|nr:unnamed protein product [Closterium sp. Yama58-4]